MESTTSIKDDHSAAQPENAVITHQHIEMKVDFDKKQIFGLTTLTITNKTHKTALFLDTRNLDITAVYMEDEHHPTAFSFLPEQPFLGKPLKISISSDEKQKIIVKYNTTLGSDALQWLQPEQTAGRKFPFLFTQGQAILSRTWFPCQDSPGIRFTYSADVTVPSHLQAIMSADIRSADSSAGRYHFEMTKPVPAYLVALSAGHLAFKEIDKRTGVFAEPEMLDRSAWEFADMGRMVDAAESLYGAYRWGRYDVLVLPPSFPFGGMENPCVTFATPTILAGDRSLTSLIAHELAHSWSGNLVTNANWNDFWLNEGFTVYFERRIMEKIEGKAYAEMLALLGYEDLQATIQDLGDTSSATHLKLDLKNSDPDDGMNDVAYEKGYLFLCHLEKLAGREKWDAFVRKYFDDHAFSSMTTETFVNYLNDNLLTPIGIAKEQANVNGWIYNPGLPAGVEVPKSARFEKAEKIAEEFAKSGNKVDPKQTNSWSSHEWLHFLRSLPENLDTPKMSVLDNQFGFTTSGNSELVFEWLLLTIRHNYRPAEALLEKFLIETGRRKFVLPLYKAMLSSKEYRQKGVQIFDKAKGNYHAVTLQSVNALFGK